MALFAITSLTALLLAGLGFLCELHPAFDSLAHFRLHLSAVAVVSGLLAFAGGWRKSALLSVAGGLAAIALTWHWLTPSKFPTETGRDRATYRLMHLNLRFNNETPERVLSFIGRTRPDIITLNEVSASWLPHLERIKAAYPHSRICQSDSVIGGVAILGRRPFLPGGQCMDGGALAFQPVDLNGSPVTVGAMHLHWPWPFQQDRQISGITDELKRLRGIPAILAGDFNAAPWSAATARLASASQMSILPGIGPTWRRYRFRSWYPLFAGLPIDQILTSGKIVAAGGRITDDIGSDHLPVIVEFSIVTDAENAEPDIQKVDLALPKAGERLFVR